MRAIPDPGDDNAYVVVTAGDDGALCCASLGQDMHGGWAVHRLARHPGAHASSVKAVDLMVAEAQGSPWLAATVSTDQRLRVWRIAPDNAVMPSQPAHPAAAVDMRSLWQGARVLQPEASAVVDVCDLESVACFRSATVAGGGVLVLAAVGNGAQVVRMQT